MESAEHYVLKHVQDEVYKSEIELLKSNNQAKLLRNSFIIKLSPTLHDNLLRVGGRLDHADVSYDVKHPVILPGKHRLTELLVRDCHKKRSRRRTASDLTPKRKVLDHTSNNCCASRPSRMFLMSTKKSNAVFTKDGSIAS